MRSSTGPWCRLAVMTAFLFEGFSYAQYPLIPDNVTVIESSSFPGASISYKETQICETTASVKGYSGYVNMPPAPAEGRPYEVHTWFWFFEARNSSDSAPLSLWFNGGPGAPSSPAAVGEHGPCLVLPNSRDTTLNQWSWNNRVNMLYIDQPVNTGFSYSALTNGTIDEVKSPFALGKSLETNATVFSGRLSSQSPASAPNSTVTAAVAMWEFMQVWMQDAPFKRPADNKFSIWAESYGGHYAPTFADYFQSQNDRIASGELSEQTVTPLLVETVGLINACIDINTQMPYYPVMANNNTYGIQLLNDSAYASAVAAVPKCLNLTTTCRSMTDRLDPEGWGNNTQVNQACLQAYMFCFESVAVEDTAGRLPSEVYHFDITSPEIASFPPKWGAGYYNTLEVQEALGVPLNWTGNSVPVSTNFVMAGDFVKGRNLNIIGQLLDRGVKVALIYGDKDYQCNWFGGEAISLAINSENMANFRHAGYAEIQTNASYVGGMVRQYGNLSFSRVYQAGHEVPYYQPETAYQIFDRVMFGRDVATGQIAVTPTYSTIGANSSISTLDQIPRTYQRQVDCYLWDILETCTPLQAAMFANGSAITKDFIMIGYKLVDGSKVMYSQYQGDVTDRGNTTIHGSTDTSANPDVTAVSRATGHAHGSRYMTLGFAALAISSAVVL